MRKFFPKEKDIITVLYKSPTMVSSDDFNKCLDLATTTNIWQLNFEEFLIPYYNQKKIHPAFTYCSKELLGFICTTLDSQEKQNIIDYINITYNKEQLRIYKRLLLFAHEDYPNTIDINNIEELIKRFVPRDRFGNINYLKKN